jgi:predicted acyl esterase
MAKQPLKVPVMWLQGLWDQEDMWGAIHTLPSGRAERHATNDKNFLGDGSVAA